MSNLLIVESKNDELFINRLLQELNLSTLIEVGTPICHIDEYECLDGLSEKKLMRKLNDVVVEIEKRGIKKIGILVDADEEGVEEKINFINNSIKNIDNTVSFKNVNQWIDSRDLDVKISCHILNIDGTGELETLLRKIKSDDSSFADCLLSWRQCLSDHNHTITDKEFDKFWVAIYQRYDACTKREKRQAGRKCNFEASLQKDIWDFSSYQLDSLKEFLLSFR